jgi:NAD(P)-dependent dehydrogenase (short-subunit alcohol dehydrogenase family)
MAGALHGRGALVTGGGRGIGAAIARALCEAGANVVISARTASEIEAVAEGLRGAGGSVQAVPCDVTDEKSVERLRTAARTHIGAVDILVNNAGASSSAPLRKITLEEWNRMLLVNATATFLCTREFAPGMADRGYGRILNIASIAGLEGAKYIAHYCAAKHAVVGFTRAMAVEFAGTGVTVNAICPGYADTPMTDRTLQDVGARAGLPRERALEAVLATTGQERLVTPQEVAAEVLKLCSVESGNRTGEAILLRGSIHTP